MANDYSELQRLINRGWGNARQFMTPDDSAYMLLKAIHDEWIEIQSGRRIHPCPSPEPGGWQPIETAPKDGSSILLGYFPEFGGRSWEVAFWHGTHHKWCGRVLLNAEGYFSPTHWMPLPASPSPTKAGSIPCAGVGSGYISQDRFENDDGSDQEETLSPWRERNGSLCCRNCGCEQGTGHHPSCIEAGPPLNGSDR